MATAVDVSGANTPRKYHDGQSIQPMEGRSLVPAMMGQPIEREAIYWEHEGNRAVRVGDYKLVAKGAKGNWELYNIAKDRSEQHDLSKSRTTDDTETRRHVASVCGASQRFAVESQREQEEDHKEEDQEVGAKGSFPFDCGSVVPTENLDWTIEPQSSNPHMKFCQSTGPFFTLPAQRARTSPVTRWRRQFHATIALKY